MPETTSYDSAKPVDSTVLWITYLNIVLFGLCFQLQRPVEPFLIKSLTEKMGDPESVSRIYGNLQSFFNTVQMLGSPFVGILLDRIGIRYTSAIVFLSSGLSYAILASAYDLNTLFLSKIPTVLSAAFVVAQATAATSTGGDSAARAAALGRMTTSYQIGATLGPALGGFLADRGDFYIGMLH
jgi:MFS family permease